MLMLVLAAVLYALGWVAGKMTLAAVWCWSAVLVGWDEAHGVRTREPVRT